MRLATISARSPRKLRRLAVYLFFIIAAVSFSAPLAVGAPVIGGIVNGASFGTGGATTLASGSIVSLFGTGLATSQIAASTLPLPTTLGTTSVSVGALAAPLIYVSSTQINLQLPWAGCCGDLIRVVTVTVNNVQSNDFVITVSAFGPAIFSVNAQGNGQGAVLIANTTTVAAAVGSVTGFTSRPAHRGEDISIFCIGLGPVVNQPLNGSAALSNPTSDAINTPTVTIGGLSANVAFAGLAPGFAGLYQVNATVPNNAAPGSAVTVRITTDAFSLQSNIVTIAVD